MSAHGPLCRPGVGAGLTPDTDSLLVKSITGYRFDFLGGK